MPNAPKPGTVQITMRVTEELAARAEQMADELRAEHPGIPIARTDAMRMILEKHLPPLRSTTTYPITEERSALMVAERREPYAKKAEPSGDRGGELTKPRSRSGSVGPGTNRAPGPGTNKKPGPGSRGRAKR